MRISSCGWTWEVWRALKKLELLSAIASSNSYASFVRSVPLASITRYTHAKYEPRLYKWWNTVKLKGQRLRSIINLKEIDIAVHESKFILPLFKLEVLNWLCVLQKKTEQSPNEQAHKLGVWSGCCSLAGWFDVVMVPINWTRPSSRRLLKAPFFKNSSFSAFLKRDFRSSF